MTTTRTTVNGQFTRRGVIVGFERGVPVSRDGRSTSYWRHRRDEQPGEALRAVGRLGRVEERLVGIKSSEI